MTESIRQEKRLYKTIKILMENRGYAVIPQFETFSPLTQRRRKLDLLGFRWTEDHDLDAWAVEAKPGALPADTLMALGQAIEYQLYVPHVSVAAEVPREALAFAEDPLRQMGLGYIHASPTTATEIIIPTLSPRFYQSEFIQVIRHAGVLCLLGRERWKEKGWGEHHSGGRETSDAAGYPFYCIHNRDPIQYMLSTTGESKKVQLRIWVEGKPVLTDIYRRQIEAEQIGAEQLVELLGRSEAKAAIFIRKRDTFGRLGNILDERPLPPDQTAITEGLDYARKRLKERRVVPVISVALELWAWDDMPRRVEAEKKVAQAIERLEPIRAYLAKMTRRS